MAESSSPVDAALPSRTAELGTLVRLALPAVATQLAQMGMGVLDTVMAGRVSAEDLAGVALGGNIIWPTMLLLMGVLMALTPNIAQ
ncbi:MAG: MATE family efflux transporter, partial [Pseudomonadota bacterium]|nr:MATE family efflux transporter [Pseudomonadota bacterium]